MAVNAVAAAKPTAPSATPTTAVHGPARRCRPAASGARAEGHPGDAPVTATPAAGRCTSSGTAEMTAVGKA